MTITDPYASGVLKKEHHDRLVADLDNYAADACIRPHWIWTALPEDVTAVETDYLTKFRHHAANGTRSGLCYAGSDFAMAERMSALAGCLVRNFVRARVMTLGSVLDALSDKSMPALTAILIPNFFLPKAEGGHLASWQVQALYDFMVDRHTRGLQTIVYASDMDRLEKEYGMAVSRLLKTQYVHVSL